MLGATTMPAVRPVVMPTLNTSMWVVAAVTPLIASPPLTFSPGITWSNSVPQSQQLEWQKSTSAIAQSTTSDSASTILTIEPTWFDAVLGFLGNWSLSWITSSGPGFGW